MSGLHGQKGCDAWQGCSDGREYLQDEPQREDGRERHESFCDLWGSERFHCGCHQHGRHQADSCFAPVSGLPEVVRFDVFGIRILGSQPEAPAQRKRPGICRALRRSWRIAGSSHWGAALQLKGRAGKGSPLVIAPVGLPRGGDGPEMSEVACLAFAWNLCVYPVN